MPVICVLRATYVLQLYGALRRRIIWRLHIRLDGLDYTTKY